MPELEISEDLKNKKKFATQLGVFSTPLPLVVPPQTA
jgi:hypothetical protein